MDSPVQEEGAAERDDSRRKGKKEENKYIVIVLLYTFKAVSHQGNSSVDWKLQTNPRLHLKVVQLKSRGRVVAVLYMLQLNLHFWETHTHTHTRKRNTFNHSRHQPWYQSQRSVLFVVAVAPNHANNFQMPLDANFANFDTILLYYLNKMNIHLSL